MHRSGGPSPGNGLPKTTSHSSWSMSSRCGHPTGSGPHGRTSLVHRRRFIGLYHNNTVADLYRENNVIKSATSQRGRPLEPNTVRDHTCFLKRISPRMIENWYNDVPVKKVEKIRGLGEATVLDESTGTAVRRHELHFQFDAEAYREWVAEPAVWLEDDVGALRRELQHV